MSNLNLLDFLVFHGNGDSFPLHDKITANNHRFVVVVVTWIMICLMGLAIIARFGTRHNLNKDCVVICVAYIRMSALLLRFDV